ncbi:MAG: hypothetical protein Q4G36_08340 [Paracoccus sp. (in: a-proteobacteria)]|nr:hypothetical protein [Paracoccus sp. (in: a-proteobacteria)]
MFDGRGRSPAARRRAHIAPPQRDDFTRNWSLLMIASFARREDVAAHFEVSFQTACNWVDGLHRPYGDAVEHARRTLPRYVEIMGGGV